jgi:AbrB family looped-hinge helix DNA binding protein
MTRSAKITSKGQLTVPVDVRRHLGVGPGDSVVFVARKSRMEIVPKRAYISPFEKYRGIGNPGIPSGRRALLKYLRELRGW